MVELLKVARQFQLEGLIAKRPDSVHESGRRSGAWVKVKLTQQQEFVIGGYTPPEGSRKYFGALLVGYYGPDGFLFAGRVGTGFSEKALATLHGGLQKIKRTTCPFCQLTREKARAVGPRHHPCSHETLCMGRPGAGRSGQVHGVTSDEVLRQPVFPGL